MKHIARLAVSALILVLCSCSQEEGQQPSAAVKAYVSILPQACFVERVGGEHVQVGVLVGPGQSPHSYEPTPKQMAELSEAEVFFSIGVPFEKRLLEKLRSREDLRIVDTREGIELRRMSQAHHHHHHEDEEAERGGHDTEHEHGQGEADPHVWLNPRNAKTIARNIADALKAIDPDHAEDYDRNLAAFLADLDATDARIAKVLGPLEGQTFLVFHPAFGYLGDAYGLKQEAVEIEGKEPTGKQLAGLIEAAREDSVRVIFVQPQFSRKSAEALAEAIDGAVVPMDPLARDYLANLESMAAAIADALKQ